MRVAEEERVAHCEVYLRDMEIGRKRLQTIARKMFWLSGGVGEQLAEKFADALPLTPEELDRASMQFDPNIVNPRLRTLSIARRLYTERGLPFPIS